MSSYILAVAFGVTALTLTTTGWCDAARVTALEAMLLGTSPTTSQADVMSKLYDALGEVIQLEVDGVRYPPRAIEACTTDTHDFCYQPCGFRHERAADRPVKVSADSIVRLGSASPNRSRLRDNTSGWCVMLHSDAALEGLPAEVGAVWWNADGRVEMKHLGPEHRFLQVLIIQPGRHWVEKITWVLDRGPVERKDFPISRYR
ncbi:MAG: hypothetical protein WBE58_23525 [Verrucomicrobiales bacterium]